jgi:protein-L-isoaspartate O-methyltransferase
VVGWQKHAERLADRAAGPDSGWHEPVSAIPRHRLVPRWWDDEGGEWRWRDGPSDPEAWLAAGYADRSLVTSVAGTHADLVGPDAVASGLPTSSATLPGLVVRMLRHARVCPGSQVLDVGTGSGYSTALLARRFGDSAITSIDVDPYLTGAARARLDEIGLRPQVITGDATGPLPGGYDRIVSMMGVRPVPPGWLAALRPGGRLVTTISGMMIIITAVKISDGTASGQVEWDQAGFMTSRPGPACPPAAQDMPGAVRVGEGEDVRTGRYPLVRVEGSGELQSMLEITAPGIRHYYEESGQACTAWMTHPDGSWARAEAPSWRDLPVVHQSGPQRLWDILDELREYWLTRGYFRLRGAHVRIAPDGTIHLSNGPWKATISVDHSKPRTSQQPGNLPAAAAS